MNIYDRIIAGTIWLEKYTVFSPYNLVEDESLSTDVIQWGNYCIGYNIYPNLFNIFAKYSPTTDILLNRCVRLTFGNIPKEIKNQRTTFESSFTNTISTLVKNAGRDSLMYKGSFAIWVGYDENGKIDEFKWLSLALVRYIKKDEALYPNTNNEYMLALMKKEENQIEGIYYPYDPSKALSQIQTEGEANSELLKKGQILFYNTASDQLYPDCAFNSMLPILLTDAGLDTCIMSLLGNSDLLNTYIKKPGTTGADSANGGLFQNQQLNNVWGVNGNSQGFSETAQYGSEYQSTGVKATGSVKNINITTEEGINNYVREPKFPVFMDEIAKIDERVARKICIALELPYEYIFKMESGVVNQDNREAFIKELNMMLEDTRETFENVINDILEHSRYDWRLQIRPIGEGKEDVAQASKNITK